MALWRWVLETATAGAAALPVELNLDPMIPIGVNRRSRWTDNDGGLLATDRGPG
jgi:hypothetical protein